jgi:hypothetical protein
MGLGAQEIACTANQMSSSDKKILLNMGASFSTNAATSLF